MISDVNCRLARLRFSGILSILSKPLREPGDEVILSDILDGLADKLLCPSHGRTGNQARNQWYMELNDGEVRSKMEGTYSHFPYQEDDSDEVDPNEKCALVLPAQSSMRQWELRKPNIEDSEVAENVTKLLESKLKVLDAYCGWIYVFSTDAEGMLKIGFTTRPPRVHRLPTHMYCYKPITEVMSELIPYARRVEQLVLAELENKQYKLVKCRCGSAHVEWLMIDEETLIRTVRKWVEFVQTFPYSANGILKADAVLPSPALKRKRPRVSRNSNSGKKSSTPGKKDSTPGKRGSTPGIQDSTPGKRGSTPGTQDSTFEKQKVSTPKEKAGYKKVSRNLCDEFQEVLTLSKKQELPGN